VEKKCAIEIRPVDPKLLLSGNGKFYSVSSRGGICFTFARAIEDYRKYNWNDRLVVVLGVQDLGMLLAWNPDKVEQLKFQRFLMEKVEKTEGRSVIKEMVWKRTSNESAETGYNVRLKVSEIENSFFLTEGEMEVLKSLIRASLPHFLVWNIKPRIGQGSSLPFGEHTDNGDKSNNQPLDEWHM